ncbi:MAG: LLM class flavin-dependent oxidoreductase [Candidatus Kariarchaeaceae archaeon]|jgi:alkanesulfonate monooxygenase SsuD/methylene tetrahydromethanopterin reductase-like flavin-dependent oxidoreductase (luciferase family)
MKLGIYLHGSSPFRPKDTITEYTRLAKHYERAGFDSLWFADHLIRTPDPNKSPRLETWSLIAGLSMITKKIRFGTLVTPITFRNIGVFAKMVSTIDHLNNGRTIVGLGNGWYSREHSMFGIPFGNTKSRMDLLENYVQNLIALWKNDDITTQDPSIIHLAEAYLNPKPIQQPYPPILIGGGGEQRTLKMVAQFAQMSNFGGILEELSRKIGILEDHCTEVDRDFKEITITTNRALIVRKTTGAIDAAITDYQKRFATLGMNVPSRKDFNKNRLVGTPVEIADQIMRLDEIGINKIILTINDEQSEKLAGEIIKEIN